ncbi:hypothetical protein FQZ97_1220990 [compost metagenome]
MLLGLTTTVLSGALAGAALVAGLRLAGFVAVLVAGLPVARVVVFAPALAGAAATAAEAALAALRATGLASIGLTSLAVAHFFVVFLAAGLASATFSAPCFRRTGLAPQISSSR